MLRSIDIEKREKIKNPRIIKWNIIATQWKWNHKKRRFYSVEYYFSDELKWEKRLVSVKEIR